MFCFTSLLASVRLRVFVISLQIIHSCRLQLQKQCYVCKWCLLSYSAAVIRAAWFQLKITYFRSTNVIGYVYLRLRKHWLCVWTFMYNHVNNVQHWLMIFLPTATTAPVFTLNQQGTFTSKTAHRQPRYHRLIQSHTRSDVLSKCTNHSRVGIHSTFNAMNASKNTYKPNNPQLNLHVYFVCSRGRLTVLAMQ